MINEPSKKDKNKDEKKKMSLKTKIIVGAVSVVGAGIVFSGVGLYDENDRKDIEAYKIEYTKREVNLFQGYDEYNDLKKRYSTLDYRNKGEAKIELRRLAEEKYQYEKKTYSKYVDDTKEYKNRSESHRYDINMLLIKGRDTLTEKFNSEYKDVLDKFEEERKVWEIEDEKESEKEHLANQEKANDELAAKKKEEAKDVMAEERKETKPVEPINSDSQPNTVKSIKHGELLDSNVNAENTLIVKAKITPSFTNGLTISQNGYNIEDIILNQGGDKYDEIQYWAVADMDGGSESKVVSFTVGKDMIKKIKNKSIVGMEIVDKASDVFILPSLKN